MDHLDVIHLSGVHCISSPPKVQISSVGVLVAVELQYKDHSGT